jgi:N-sulfoglucosamine sulfohydrolase
MNSHTAFPFVLLAALAVTTNRPSLATERPNRPNVLLITADDLGLQPGCYGETVIETPHIDALARRGTLFETAYVTQASCSPSRSSMFTGLYPHANGQYGLLNAGADFELHEPLRDQTIPAHLKRAGYRTGIIGKLHVGPEASFPFDERLRTDMRDVRSVAETVEPFLKAAEPFFLMVNYADPHAWRENRQSRAWSFPDQWKGLPEHPKKIGEVPPFPFQRIDSPAQLERVTGYYNTVLRLDAGIGLLMGVLERTGHAEDTLIIFVGDHGPPFARGKTTCYEAGLRVPFLVSWPGVSKPGRSEAMVSTVDILPTILDAAGLEPGRNMHGRSVRPLVSDPEARGRQHLAAEFHYHGSRPFYPRRAIRDRRYKLIHNLRAGEAKPSTGIDGDTAYAQSSDPKFDGTDVRRAFDTFADPPEFELYDLQTDPWEFHNLADDPAHAERLAELKQALSDWRRGTADPLLDPQGFEKIERQGASAR